MEVMHERAAGLDVHKETVVACARLAESGKAKRESRTFATTTEGLTELLAWLQGFGCSVVAMEATGVFWTPVWKILSDGEFTLLVANAAHIKTVPGRKTDMNDAAWIADLAAFGLIRASFVPEEGTQELRSLMRARKQMVRDQTRQTQRIQKTLTEANIKLDSVISDIMGLNGRRIIEGIIKGVRSPRALADLADKRLKASPKQLYDALHGRLRDHHRFMLHLHLTQWDALEQSIRTLDAQIDQRLERLDAEAAPGEATFCATAALLTRIPGLSRLSAITILSEIGMDMSRFATAGHLVSWAGMCPTQNESAGKRKPSRLRKGAPWLKTMLVQCAWAAQRTKNSYYAAQFRRLRSRRGPQKAICAVAASLLTAIYHIVKKQVPYQDLGVDYFARQSAARKTEHLISQITKLGYVVIPQPTLAA